MRFCRFQPVIEPFHDLAATGKRLSGVVCTIMIFTSHQAREGAMCMREQPSAHWLRWFFTTVATGRVDHLTIGTVHRFRI